MSTPPAKFCKVPLNAIPTATPAEAKMAINEVVFMPKMPITVTISIKYSTIRTMLSTNTAKERSMLRRANTPLTTL